MSFVSLLTAYVGTTEDAEGNTQYIYGDVWTSFAKDSLMYVFMYAAIALAVILLGVGLFVNRKKPQSLAGYVRTAIALAVGFSLTVIVAMLALEFYDMAENGYVFDLVLWPSVALGIVILLGAAAVYVASLYSKKALKIAAIAAGSAAGAAFVALFVCLCVYFATGAAEDNNYIDITPSENVALYLCAAALIAVIVALAFVCGKRDKKGFDSKAISYAAICIAMSFALSYIAPIHMPYGGSVTIASLVPLMIYSYMFGTKKGALAGAVYGLLQVIQDPWIIHPAQLLLDYPIAFAGIGLAGMFAHVKSLKKVPQVQFLLGALIAGVLRFTAHLFSGVFAFSENAPDVNAWIYSLGYNSAYVFPDIAICIVVGAIVFSSKAFMRQVKRLAAEKTPVSAVAAEPAQLPAAEPVQLPAAGPMPLPAAEPMPLPDADRKLPADEESSRPANE